MLSDRRAYKFTKKLQSSHPNSIKSQKINHNKNPYQTECWKKKLSDSIQTQKTHLMWR